MTQLAKVDQWFISDHHFFHSNILKFTKEDGTRIRPQYSSIEEMNEDYIEKWNKCIKPEHKVYHLGDVTFRYDYPFRELMSRLNGRKRLILGNHDHIKGTPLMDYFEKLDLWQGFNFKDGLDFTCSHIPLRLDSLRNGKFNVHGHIHQNTMEDPHYYCVCVEHTDGYPVHIEEIRDYIKEHS